jgi:RNA polymerase sigma factor (sigma-70 family)
MERTGVVASLDELARRHGQELVTFAYLLVRDAGAAQDLVQGVLARLTERGLEGIDNPVGYAKRSLVNDAGQLHRRRSRWARLRPLLTAPTYVDTPVVEDRLRLWAAMDGLSAPQRAALVLRYYEDLDDAAIAEVLGCAPATVRSHLSRGLARLRPLLEDEG